MAKKVVYKKDPVTGQLVRSDLEGETPQPQAQEGISTPMGVASAGGSPQQAAMVSQTGNNLGASVNGELTNKPKEAPSASAMQTAPGAAPAGPAADLLSQLRYGGKAGQAAAEAPALSSKAQKQRTAAETAVSATAGLSGLDALMQGKANAALSASQPTAPNTVGEGGTSVNVTTGEAEPVAPTAYTQEDVTSALTQGLTSALKSAGDFTVTREDLASLGYDDAKLAELEGVLGRSPIGMKAEDLKAAVEGAARSITAAADTERAISEDLSLGENARAAAAESAAESERALGAAPEEIDRAIESLMDVGTIDFFGQKLTPEQLLSDSSNNQLILKYINGTEEDKAELRAQSPELAKWLDTNEKTVRDALQAEDDREQAEYEKAVQVKGWYTALDTAGIPKELQKAWVEAANSGSGVASDLLNDPVALTRLKEFAGSGAFMADLLKGEFGDYPALKAMGLFSSDPAVFTTAVQRFQSFVDAYQDIDALTKDGKVNTPEEVVAALFPAGTTMTELKAMLQNPAQFAGNPMLEWAQSLFDRDKDGVLAKGVNNLPLLEFKKRLKDALLKGSTFVNDMSAPTTLAAALKIPGMGNQAAAFGDGKITAEEAPAIAGIVTSSGGYGAKALDMEKALTPFIKDEGAAGPIRQALGRVADSNIQTLMNEAAFGERIDPTNPEFASKRVMFPPGDPASPDTDWVLTSWGSTPEEMEANIQKAKTVVDQLIRNAGKTAEGTVLIARMRAASSNLQAYLDKLGAIPDEASDRPVKPGDTFTVEGYIADAVKGGLSEAGKALTGGVGSAISQTAETIRDPVKAVNHWSTSTDKTSKRM